MEFYGTGKISVQSKWSFGRYTQTQFLSILVSTGEVAALGVDHDRFAEKRLALWPQVPFQQEHLHYMHHGQKLGWFRICSVRWCYDT